MEGEHASGTVSFPLIFEGPPSLVHGGFLAVFFDCVIQHHNCDYGTAGKTTALNIEYLRATPILRTLQFEIDRTSDARRITSTASIELDGCGPSSGDHRGGRRRPVSSSRSVTPPPRSKVSTALVPPLTVGGPLWTLRPRPERVTPSSSATSRPSLTPGKRLRRSAALARGLIALGVGHELRVRLLHPDGPEFVVGSLATARIGGGVSSTQHLFDSG